MRHHGKTEAMRFVVSMMRMWGWSVSVLHHDIVESAHDRPRFPHWYDARHHHIGRRHEPDWAHEEDE